MKKMTPITQDVVNTAGGLVTAEPSRANLKAAFDAIRNKRSDLDLLFSYYDGPQPLKYSTERLADTFQSINAHFDVNWCAVVVDSTLDRIGLAGFGTKNKDSAINERLKLIFDKLHIDIEADKAHQASLTTSQGYVIVWQDDGQTVLYYNDPRMCHVFYEDANPRKKRYAAKWFQHTDGRQEITLYYTDRIEHWISPKSNGAIDKEGSFVFDVAESNTFGVIPVFELKSPGEIFKILTLQDAENKLFSDMMVAAEFGAFVQRYVISQSDPGTLKNAPNEIWWIPSGDGTGEGSQIGQFQTTDLNNYLAAMDKIAGYMAIITRTPKHYFMMTGADVSGEALLAMESGLIKKCQKRMELFEAQWQDIAAFIAQLDGMSITADDIDVIWGAVESTQPLTEMQVVQTGVNTGIPMEVLLKRRGWSQSDIDEITKAKQAADANAAKRLQDRLNAVRVPVDMLNNGVNNGGQA